MTEQADHGASADEALARELAALRADRDELERRALEAETLAEALADELAEARRRLAAAPSDTGKLTLFDGPGSGSTGRSLAPDGSDRGVLPLALGATAVVALLVALLSFINGGPALIGLVMLGAGLLLAFWSFQTRVEDVRVRLDDGVVTVVSGGTTKRFDLRSEHVKVDVRGRPGDSDWRVRLYRRAFDPVDVDASSVDPAEFMTQLRTYRPGL